MANNDKRWSGRSRGGSFGYGFFIFLMNVFGIRAAYAFLSLVVVYFIPFAPRATRAVWFYNRRILRYGVFRSAVKLYAHYYALGQTIIDRVAIGSGMADRYKFEFENYDAFLRLLDGGRGAVMQADPLYRCWAHVCEEAGSRGHTIYLSPCGRTFTQSVARELKDKYDHLILVCGHYEGIDQRFIDECVDEELSMGDFVVTGGEIPAMAVTDAICRMVPGVLPEEECFTEESHWAGLLEYPQYSRPDEWHGRRVPDVLLSGHHENVAKWRKKESYKRTILRRPDLWAQFDEKQLKTKSEKKVLAEAKAEAEAIRAAEVKKAEKSDTETTVE